MVPYIALHFLQLDSLSATAVTIQKRFELLDSCFVKAIELIAAVTANAHVLNLELADLKNNLPWMSFEPAANAGTGTIPTHHVTSAAVAENDNGHSSTHFELSDAISSITKFSKSTKNLVTLFDELPNSIENGKDLLNIAHALGEGASELSTAIGASQAILNADSIASLAAGVTGIAEASLPLGPAGILVSLAAVTLGAQLSDEKGGPVPLENFTSDKMRVFYMERERQRDYERLIELHNVSNYKQLGAVENELDSDYMVMSRAQRVDKYLENFEVGYPLMSTKWAVGAPTKHKPTIPNIINAPQVTESITLADEIKRLKDLAAFESMGGKVNEIKLATDIANARKKFGKVVEHKWRLPNEREWELHRREELGLPHPDMLPQKRHSRLQQADGGTRVININRPLIEHFTVNTASTTDGINKLKDKIEETLLAILNDSLI